MDTARCKAFVAAVKTGSFHGAAEELHYTTSAVSQLITALEQDLKVPLFHRSRKGVTLTSDGQRLYSVIYNFVRQEEKIYETAAEINGLIVGEVRISAFYSITSMWLTGILRDFQKKYPGVVIRLDDNIRRYILDALNKGQADVGFLSDHHDFNGEWIHLALNPMVAVVGKDSPYAELDSFPLSELETADLIQPSHGQDPDLMEMCEKYGLTPNIIYSTRNSFTAAALASRNLGVLIVNELSSRMWAFDVKVLPLDPPQHISLGMAVPAASLASPAVRTFVRFVREYLANSGLPGRETGDGPLSPYPGKAPRETGDGPLSPYPGKAPETGV